MSNATTTESAISDAKADWTKWKWILLELPIKNRRKRYRRDSSESRHTQYALPEWQRENRTIAGRRQVAQHDLQIVVKCAFRNLQVLHEN